MEGPSVHHLAEKLNFFEGQRINFVGGNADQPSEMLKKQTIDRVRAVKKRLFFDTGSVVATVHFLMFGSYRVNQSRDGVKPRLILDCTDDVFFTYNSSVKILEAGDDTLDDYDRTEVDVLSDQFDGSRATEALNSSKRLLVDVLLDQEIFGGVGNIIKNEVLFRTNHFPELRSNRLGFDEAKKLVEETIKFANHWLETKRNDESLGLKIYQKNTCPHCGDDVKKKELGESNRVTYWCPTCQCK